MAPILPKSSSKAVLSLDGDSLTVGCGWDPIASSQDTVDFDLTCFLFDKRGTAIEAVYYNHLQSNDGSLMHSGDNRDGVGDGDDESVFISLPQIPSHVTAIAFTVSQYSSASSGRRWPARAHARLIDHSQREIHRFDGDILCSVVGVLFREGGAWRFDTHVEPLHGAEGQAATPVDLVRHVQSIPRMRQLFPAMLAGSDDAVQFQMKLRLQKGESVKLKTNESLSRVFLGLGWDVDHNQRIDLDATCVCFDARENVIDVVFFNHLTSKCGAIRHSGDNLTGEGEGDDERIMIDLKRVPANTDSLVIVINSYEGAPFSIVKNAFCRLVSSPDNNPRTEKELVYYNLANVRNQNTALVVCKLQRSERHGDTNWVLTAIGHPCYGKTYQQCLPQIGKFLAPNAFKFTPPVHDLQKGERVNGAGSGQPAENRYVLIFLLLIAILFKGLNLW